MKIAFVGKGGSGKTTVSSLFTRFLASQNLPMVAIDADINQHMASMIGADFDEKLALSNRENTVAIRQYLTGNNQRILSSKSMIKTTPPGKGSNLVTIDDNNEVIRLYGKQFAPRGYFMHVGTYQEDSIGMSCYHTSLSILENILSHSKINHTNEWIVVDMVAGTDAFSGPLHIMFDVIYMVVEPTLESVSVYQQFYTLAKQAHVEDRIRIVANKIEDDDDIAYIKQETDSLIVAHIPYSAELRKHRRNGGVIAVSEDVTSAMEQIQQESLRNIIPLDDHLHRLFELHKVFARQGFTVKKYGETLSHIDSEFSFDTGV